MEELYLNSAASMTCKTYFNDMYFGWHFLASADNTSLKVTLAILALTLPSGESLDFWSTAQFQVLRLSLIDTYSQSVVPKLLTPNTI